MATCTSGEPVSESWVLYVPMSSVLRSLVSATLSSTNGPGTSSGTRHAVCLKICYSNKLNMLHQNNRRVQKARTLPDLCDGDERAGRIDQTHPAAVRTPAGCEIGGSEIAAGGH